MSQNDRKFSWLPSGYVKCFMINIRFTPSIPNLFTHLEKKESNDRRPAKEKRK